MFATDTERWAAVQQRNQQADGHFVYSVASTGIYCRPSCAARPKRRENVAFHADCAAAERAGFRACRRCRPNGPSETERQIELVAAACRAIEAAETPPDLPTLAAAAGLSPFHFHRLFRARTGVTPKQYATARRAERARAALAAQAPVTQALYEAGYNASSRFYENAATELGMQPRQYRSGGSGAALRFATGPCSLGHVLVAATDNGVACILLGDDPAALLRDLQTRFPRAELIGGDAAFERTVARVIGCIDQARPLGLPLDVAGTAFQKQVWDALRQIPPGRTVTYAEIAAAIGRPSAARAVAAACAANPLAVAIPCHRVIRKTGDPAGYRWGIARKRALLDRERAFTRSQPSLP